MSKCRKRRNRHKKRKPKRVKGERIWGGGVSFAEERRILELNGSVRGSTCS
jgi:hypothetical protein